MEVSKISADQDRKMTALYLIIATHLGFKPLSWLLQRFGHIKSKNKDTTPAVNLFVFNQKVRSVPRTAVDAYG